MKIKTPQEIEIMKEGGKLLASVRDALFEAIEADMNAYEIETLACELIAKTGGEPSFKRVPGYSWATCVNVNDGVVHGIPKKGVVFKNGDIVSVDVGLYFKGFHTDTSFTKGLNVDEKTKTFLHIGRKSLDNAISKACIGNKISDISQAYEKTLKGAGYSPVTSLVGHGVGRDLHEDPQVPCVVHGYGFPNPELKEGLVLALEVMYTMGSPDVVLDDDGWTIVTRDGTMSALYEETVAITKNGPIVLTKANED